MFNERLIRAYCPMHKTGTTALAAPVLLCEIGDHALSQNFPNAEFWEYCCDCQSFRPSEIAAGGEVQERCMVCERRIARRFLCEHCQVISIESEEVSKRRKPYVVSAAGAVEPECPGCLRADGLPVRAHACRAANATISTSREVCPFCDEPIRTRPVTAAAAAVTTPLMPSGESAAARYCANCGAPAPNEFCSKCGASQAPAADVPDSGDNVLHDTAPIFNATDAKPVTPMHPLVTPPTTGGSSSKGVFIGLAVVSLIAVIAVAVSLTNGRAGSSNSLTANASYNESTESKLERAISQANLVQPTGESAQDYYDQLVRENASSSRLSALRDRLLPLLNEKPQRMVNDLYEPGSPDSQPYEWEEAAKLAAWASRLSPNDTKLGARAAYCEGRVAYLGGNMSEARRLWQRAADLDSTWALPINGVGLTYVDSSNRDRGKWAQARQYYQAAINRDGSWAVPYNNLGTSYYMEKDYVTARDYYNRAANLATRWARPRAWLGDVAMASKDCETAAREYKAAIDIDPVSRPGWNVAEIQRKYDKAARWEGCY